MCRLLAPCGTVPGPRNFLPSRWHDCRTAGLQEVASDDFLPIPKPVILQSCHPAMVSIPRDQDNVILPVDGKEVRLTNLRKIFWPELGLTKGDLLRYYADVAGVLLPHIRDRAMVMRRYPHGAAGASFFMKREIGRA